MPLESLTLRSACHKAILNIGCRLHAGVVSAKYAKTMARYRGLCRRKMEPLKPVVPQDNSKAGAKSAFPVKTNQIIRFQDRLEIQWEISRSCN